MKKLIFAAVIALTFTACDNRQAEVDQANRQKDSLASIINERDSSLNDFLSSFPPSMKLKKILIQSQENKMPSM